MRCPIPETKFSLTKALTDLLEGRTLTPDQLEGIRRKLERDADNRARYAENYRLALRPYMEEIYYILADHPGEGFTPTDIQFHMRDFVDRGITCQFVTALLDRMLRDDATLQVCRAFGTIHGNNRNCYRGSVYYVGLLPERGYYRPIWNITEER